MIKNSRWPVITTLAVLVAPHVTASQSPSPARGTSPAYSQEAYVVEESRTTWRFENDGTGRRDRYLRVRVQSDAGIAMWGQLAFPYNSANERMEVVSVRVLGADGTVVTAPADAVQDLSSPVQREAPVYTDTREKHITVPGLRPGQVVELALTIVMHTPLAPGHFWAEHEFIGTGIVLDDRLQLDMPRDRSITLKTRSGLDQTVTERDGRRLYEWRTARLANDESDAKSARDISRKLRKPEPAAVRLTTFASWEELGRWFGDLERPQRAPSVEIRKKAKDLTANRATEMDKLEALYEYVATNFRYVSLSFGVGRYQPHAAADVLRNQYGDCKDKHTLLASLAQSIGLQTSAVLIHSAKAIDPEFPSPSQFDHVITRVAVGADVVWLDATTEVAPFRLLAPTLRKKQALVVNASGAARLEESPAATPMPNVTTADIDATLTESGTLSAHVRLTFAGDYELVMRTIFRRVPATQWKEMLSSISGRGGLDGDVSDWKVGNPAALRDPFSVEYQVKKANYIRQAKKDFELELPLADWISVGPNNDESDGTSPIDIGSAGQSSYKVRVELPASLAARPPVSVSMKRDYAEYRADYTLEGRVFTAERSLKYEERELPAARRGDFAAFTRAVSGDLRQSLALESRVAAAVDGLAKQSAKELYKSGTDAVDSQRYAQAVELLKRLVELEPTHNGGWTNLGRAYIGLHQIDAAIEAFRQQIAINAFDQYAYNNLGAAYRSQRKFSEAEAAFRKQLEIDPLNQFAHESLGRMYLGQHQYDAAVPELEKAIALSPLDASLRIRYGEAMLNRGERDRALEIFSRAVDLDPSPLTWNDIAYRLALNHTDLDLAQRYAESAVSVVSAATRTIAIDHITVRDLWQIGSIGSYWDTLGWVYFAKGDIVRAEKLVAAAWSLKQDAEVGDHLGQVFERAGRREDAIRTYAVTMSAERPDEKTRERLVALAGGAERAAAAEGQCGDQLQRDRTISLEITGPAGSTADFYVLLANQSGDAVVEAVSFISGDEVFRRFGDALTKAEFGAAFPDGAPAKILRRGTVSCGTSDRPGPCRFVMMLPSEAQAAHRQ